MAKVRIFSDKNIEKFCQLLQKQDWQDVYFSDSVDSMFHNFHDKLNQCFNVCFPLTKPSACKKRSSWFTKGLCVSREKKKLLLQKIKYDRTPELSLYVKSYCKIYKKVINAAKRLFNDEYILKSKNMSKAIWNVVNQTKTKRTNGVMLKDGDRLVQNPSDVANMFSNHFTNCSVASKPTENLSFDESDTFRCTRSLFFYPVTASEILKQLKNRNKFSVGIDEVPDALIKHVVNVLCDVVVFMFNSSLSEGIFPTIYKVTKVVPVHKKGPKDDVNNYRPISLQTSFAKLLESLVYTRCAGFCNQENLIPHFQHGFTKGRDVTSAVDEFISNIYRNVDSNRITAGIFIDLKKAFDTVNHTLLVAKLFKLGFRGVCNKWFVSYLSGRQQFVEVRDINGNIGRSKTTIVACGVPQGSILGPLLFNLFMYDLTVNQGKLILYADDTNVIVDGVCVEEVTLRITDVLRELDAWMMKNRMSINYSKSNIVWFGTHQNLQLKDAPPSAHDEIHKVNSVCFLGFQVDEHLRWHNHTELLVNKLSSLCFMFRVLRQHANNQVLRAVYYGKVFSVLKFGIIFWGGSASSEKVFILQKKIMRIIHGLKYNESCRDAFASSNILTLPSIYIFESLKHVFKNRGALTRNNELHQYTTRHGNRFNLPSHRTSFFEKCPAYSGMKLFNHLPDRIRKLDNSRNFKDEVKKILLKTVCYSIDDYLNSKPV